MAATGPQDKYDDIGADQDTVTLNSTAISNLVTVSEAGGDFMGPVSVSASGEGVGDILTAVVLPGWLGTGYQWYRNGVTLSGETSATYTRVQADAGCRMSVRVTSIPYEASRDIEPSIALEYADKITPMIDAIRNVDSARTVINWAGMSIVAGVGANGSTSFGASAARVGAVAPLLGALIQAAYPGGVQSLGMEEMGYSGSGSLWSYTGSPVVSTFGSQGPDGYEVNLAGGGTQAATIAITTTRANQTVRLYGRVVGGAGVITPRYSMSGANTLATTNLPASSAAAPLPAGTSWWYETNITVPIAGVTSLTILCSTTAGHNLALRGADLDYYVSTAGITIHRLARSGMGMADLLASSLDDTDTEPAGNWIGGANATRRQAQALSMTSRITGTGFDWVSTDVNDIQQYASFGYVIADFERHLDNFIADQLAKGRYTLFITGLGLRNPSAYTGAPPFDQMDIIASIRAKVAASTTCALIDLSTLWSGATNQLKYNDQVADTSLWIASEAPDYLHPSAAGHAYFARQIFAALQAA